MKATYEKDSFTWSESQSLSSGLFELISFAGDFDKYMVECLNTAKKAMAGCVSLDLSFVHCLICRSPKPQKPFAPSLKQLDTVIRSRDAAIDNLLRPPNPKLPSELPPADEELVEKTFRKRGVIAKIAREQVSDIDISRLQPRQWLNDELINFYGAMIMARAEEQKENMAVQRGQVLNSLYLSTFFWAKLVRDGYEKGRLAKWTKKVDIFSKDVVLIPVNHDNTHWTAAAINFRKKRFESFDSMGMAKETVWKVRVWCVNIRRVAWTHSTSASAGVCSTRTSQQEEEAFRLYRLGGLGAREYPSSNKRLRLWRFHLSVPRIPLEGSG